VVFVNVNKKHVRLLLVGSPPSGSLEVFDGVGVRVYVSIGVPGIEVLVCVDEDLRGGDTLTVTSEVGAMDVDALVGEIVKALESVDGLDVSLVPGGSLDESLAVASDVVRDLQIGEVSANVALEQVALEAVSGGVDADVELEEVTVDAASGGVDVDLEVCE
jgi:hypothetical protein